MKHLLYRILSLLLILTGGSLRAQRVTNVDFAQEGNKVVVTYELDCQSTISVSVSQDGGRSYGPALQCVTGDVGRGVEPSRKRIVWDVLREIPAGISGDIAFKVNVLTNDFTIRVNGVAFDMVYVEGGTFTMGATADQVSEAENDENLAHRVAVSDFYIGKYEVTQAQWKSVMGSNPSYFKGDDLPVENVSWDDIQDFLRKLNAQSSGRRYRLPTEAEWEYAVRGGNKSRGYKYSGGNDVGSVAWYYDNFGYKTHPVGQKSPNELGLYDMSGNVWEWCQDWYGPYGSSFQTDPTGPSTRSGRVLRGGGCYGSARLCRVSGRGIDTPNNRFYISGFRLVSF